MTDKATETLELFAVGVSYARRESHVVIIDAVDKDAAEDKVLGMLAGLEDLIVNTVDIYSVEYVREQQALAARKKAELFESTTSADQIELDLEVDDVTGMMYVKLN